MKFETDRYSFDITELQQGGPGGYESTYLTSEGFPVDEGLYDEFSRFEGTFLPADNHTLRQRNGKALENVLSNGLSSGIASGFKPSGAYHFGHKLTSGTVGHMQKNGIQVFIPVADVEAEMDSSLTTDEYKFWAADNLLDWGANGVDLDAAHVYLQSQEYRVNALSYVAARSLLFNTAVDIYGAEKMVEVFPFLFAGMTQVRDILLPQHSDFGNDHSFMVSGQDQDGHMKMTTALTEATLQSGVNCMGVSTVPSGLYIPHMRGISGEKASSSKSESTTYLGQGPNFEDLDQRIASSLKKLDIARSNNLSAFCLDMVRYIDEFNEHSEVNFEEITRADKYQQLLSRLDSAHSLVKENEVLNELDEYLDKTCREQKQDNEELVRDNLPEVMKNHQRKREVVLEHAVRLAKQKDISSCESSKKPDFWATPETAQVNSDQAHQSRWYDLVANNADRLIP